MPIQSKHIQHRPSGEINIERTLCIAIQDHIKDSLAGDIFKIMRVDFLSKLSTTQLAFRVRIDQHGTQEQSNQNLMLFKSLMNIDDEFITTITNEETNVTELHICDTNTILSFFKALEYESLLTNERICLSHNVDVLQLLIARTLFWLIKKIKISTNEPELVEFNQIGHLSAIVISPDGHRYQLNNTAEVCSFFKKYCKYELPPHFIALIRSQLKINASRFVHELSKLNAQGIPLVLAQNQFKDVIVSTDLCKLSFELDQREHHEYRLFEALLHHELGADYLFQWRQRENKSYLVLSVANSQSFTNVHISHIREALTRFQLLPQSQLVALHDITSAPLSEPTVPESIERIFECKITYGLPTGAPVITPKGNSYDHQALLKSLQHRAIDPCDPSYPLNPGLLRKNLLAERLINYYRTHPAHDHSAQAPDLLKNPITKQFYINPIVDVRGETIEGTNNYYSNLQDYPNRCVADLIRFYQTILTPLDMPIIRAGVRATIGANLGLLCSGTGALSAESAQDESNVFLPYVDYRAEKMMVYFASEEYARRFELGIKQWCQDSSSPVFLPDEVSMYIAQHQKTVWDVTHTARELTFHANVEISNPTKISMILEHLCKLPPMVYFEALKKLTGSEHIDILNDIIQTKELNSWSKRSRSMYEENSFSPQATHLSILEVRANVDQSRMYSSEPFAGIVNHDEEDDRFCLPEFASLGIQESLSLTQASPMPDFLLEASQSSQTFFRRHASFSQPHYPTLPTVVESSQQFEDSFDSFFTNN